MATLITTLFHAWPVRTIAKVAVKGSLDLWDAGRGAVGAARQSAAAARTPVAAGPSTASAPSVVAGPPPAVAAPAAAPLPAPPAATAPAPVRAASKGETAPKPTILAVDGIGPKVAEVLAAAGIDALDQLAATDEERLREILMQAGSPYRSMDPSTWPGQARQLLASAR